VWAKADRWARLRPTVPSFSTFAMEAWMKGVPMAAPTTAALVSPGGFIAFEHQWAVGAAFRFHQQIGRRRIGERIRALNDQCKAGLAAIPKVTVHTPRSGELSAGLVTFEVDGVPTPEVVTRLFEKKIIASAAPYAVSYARLAPSLVNDPAEVDAAVRAVREIAGA
jgi:selenocysteine lyase/cysteine desulfurase